MPTDPDAGPDHDVVVVGGGFSGIGAGIFLDKAGFGDYLILEAGDGIGGTWHWNTYPGVAVDIPSFSYQFSFEQRTDWSRVYAPGQELKAYAEHCVDTYDLRRRIRLNTRVIAATFDDTDHRWRLEIDDGTTLTARHVIGATGVLTQPKPPEIAGVDDFAGVTMHTSRWDHDVDLAGKRVAIIGTGASAVQVIPSIAAEVADLTVFQRTPIWCLPKLDATLPKAARLAMRLPGARRALRLVSQTFVEATFPLAAHFPTFMPFAKLGERLGLNYLERAVEDPKTRAKLTPDYALGCKRPSFSNDYLPTFNQKHVHLETTAIEKITSTGIRTTDGTERAIDVLILATGFKVFEVGNMPPFPVRGSGNADLEEFWTEHRFQAFQGINVPAFPNFFSILGPYGYNGSSYFNLIETQMAHIVRCLVTARRRGATRVEVTEEANSAFHAAVLSRRPRQVFFQGRCHGANSYYFDAHGDVPFRPSPTLETMWAAHRFDLDAYRFETV